MRKTIMGHDNNEVGYSLSCNCVATHEQDGTPLIILPGRSVYRTSCRHIICESCASRAFTTGCLCPVCNTKLSDGQVQELMIGVPPNDITTALFQTAFQDPQMDAILDNTYKAVSAAYDLQLFVQNQLLHELVTHREKGFLEERRVTFLTEEQNKTNLLLKKARSENTTRVKDLEYHITMRENELCEIKDAYKEKLRKCDAWEKAYNSLKHQQQDSSSAFDSGIPTSYPPVHSTSALHTRNTIPSSAVAASPTGFMPSEVQCQEHADGFMKRGTTAARGEVNSRQNINRREKISYSFSTTAPSDRRFSHLIPAEESGGYSSSRAATRPTSRMYPPSSPPTRFDHQDPTGGRLLENVNTRSSCISSRSSASSKRNSSFTAFSASNHGYHAPSVPSEEPPKQMSSSSGFFDSTTKKGGERSKRFFNK